MIRVVGHRGAAGILPENTLKGFQHAIELGVDFVECDVHLTRDRHLVVIHDSTLDRTTNGHGPVRSFNLASLRALDAGQGEQIPLLDDVLETVRDKVKLLCELKGNDVEERAVDLVIDRRMEKEVFFTSFDLDRLEYVKNRRADLQTCAIFVDPTPDDIRRAHDLGVACVDVLYKSICLRIIDHVKSLGLGLRAWNPDSPREQQAMIALGVEDISSNRPDVLLKLIRKNRVARS